MGRTSDTPYVSHLARERGKTGKSTARIERMVIKIMWARYVVSAGSGAIKDAFADFPGDVACLVCLGEDGLDTRSAFDGKGVPDSRGGISSSKLVGNKRIKTRSHGLLAKRVIERRRGRMRMGHSVRKCTDFEGGRRD